MATFNWYLLPHLLGTRADLAGTLEAIDAFPGWNGITWGSAPTEDMILDFDEPDGTACYWRDRDRQRAAREQLLLGEYLVNKVLYSFKDGRLCSIGFSLAQAYDYEGVRVSLLAAYGDPELLDETSDTHGWNGDTIAVRLRRKGDDGGSVAWFNVPLARGRQSA